ncbi:jmjc domain-containing histone demethylase 2 isoform a [Anaeramoeba flamelloides]|uniref:Jmjc domain-containing histone demethylase 2 isoform a n=1 Tax=Anaeramoeba flamelloides TaxID=1746091 RepID=A0AAV7ZP64_9EUKA|nr:jmjc domain-containing histone demethylase 2 isoform a [Anaeramoeba flamelloides]
MKKFSLNSKRIYKQPRNWYELFVNCFYRKHEYEGSSNQLFTAVHKLWKKIKHNNEEIRKYTDQFATKEEVLEMKKNAQPKKARAKGQTVLDRAIQFCKSNEKNLNLRTKFDLNSNKGFVGSISNHNHDNNQNYYEYNEDKKIPSLIDSNSFSFQFPHLQQENEPLKISKIKYDIGFCKTNFYKVFFHSTNEGDQLIEEKMKKFGVNKLLENCLKIWTEVVDLFQIYQNGLKRKRQTNSILYSTIEKIEATLFELKLLLNEIMGMKDGKELETGPKRGIKKENENKNEEKDQKSDEEKLNRCKTILSSLPELLKQGKIRLKKRIYRQRSVKNIKGKGKGNGKGQGKGETKEKENQIKKKRIRKRKFIEIKKQKQKTIQNEKEKEMKFDIEIEIETKKEKIREAENEKMEPNRKEKRKRKKILIRQPRTQNHNQNEKIKNQKKIFKKNDYHFQKNNFKLIGDLNQEKEFNKTKKESNKTKNEFNKRNCNNEILCFNFQTWEEVNEKLRFENNMGKVFYPLKFEQIFKIKMFIKILDSISLNQIFNYFKIPKTFHNQNKLLIENQLLNLFPLLMIRNNDDSIFINLETIYDEEKLINLLSINNINNAKVLNSNYFKKIQPLLIFKGRKESDRKRESLQEKEKKQKNNNKNKNKNKNEKKTIDENQKKNKKKKKNKDENKNTNEKKKKDENLKNKKIKINNKILKFANKFEIVDSSNWHKYPTQNFTTVINHLPKFLYNYLIFLYCESQFTKGIWKIKASKCSNKRDKVQLFGNIPLNNNQFFFENLNTIQEYQRNFASPFFFQNLYSEIYCDIKLRDNNNDGNNENKNYGYVGSNNSEDTKDKKLISYLTRYRNPMLSYCHTQVCYLIEFSIMFQQYCSIISCGYLDGFYLNPNKQPKLANSLKNRQSRLYEDNVDYNRKGNNTHNLTGNVEEVNLDYLVLPTGFNILNNSTKASYFYDQYKRKHFKLPDRSETNIYNRSCKYNFPNIQSFVNDLFHLYQQKINSKLPVLTLIVNSSDIETHPHSIYSFLYFGRLWRDLKLDMLNICCFTEEIEEINPINSISTLLNKKINNNNNKFEKKYLQKLNLVQIGQREQHDRNGEAQENEENKNNNGNEKKIFIEEGLNQISEMMSVDTLKKHTTHGISIQKNSDPLSFTNRNNQDKFHYSDLKDVRTFFNSSNKIKLNKEKFNNIKNEITFLLKHTTKNENLLYFKKCQNINCIHCQKNKIKSTEIFDFLDLNNVEIPNPICSTQLENHFMTFIQVVEALKGTNTNDGSDTKGLKQLPLIIKPSNYKRLMKQKENEKLQSIVNEDLLFTNQKSKSKFQTNFIHNIRQGIGSSQYKNTFDGMDNSYINQNNTYFNNEFENINEFSYINNIHMNENNKNISNVEKQRNFLQINDNYKPKKYYDKVFPESRYLFEIENQKFI